MKIFSPQVGDFIPHREPFSFVKSVELVGADGVEGTCVWSENNPIFAGHFPGFPLVPGVLMVEAAAQLVGILISYRGRERQAMASQKSLLGMLIGIKRASFHKPVWSDEEIFYKMRLGNAVGGMVIAEGGAENSAGEKVCKCEISVAIVDPNALKKS